MPTETIDAIPLALRAELDELPSMPSVVSSCLDELHDAQSNAQRVADLMLADVGLTARALHLVNSSFFALSTEVRSLSHAIALLGSVRLEEIILSVVMPQLFGKGPGGPLVLKTWEHSFATAFIARELAVRLGFPRPTNAYVAGLMHDLGLIVAVRCLPVPMRRVVEELNAIGHWDLGVEVRQLQTHHAIVGASLARKWDFPNGIIDTIHDHHSPSGSDPLIGLVHVADQCASAAGLGILEREENDDFDLLTHCQETPGLADALAIPADLNSLALPYDWAVQVRTLVADFVQA
ncbi:MAG: HDOD domain-containing protein [Nitrospirota bacterium]|jgi:putative nucleotidyltransferase with HDIG domain